MESRQIGRYQVLEEIASGGQATVFRAWDTQTGQVVALKVLHPHLAKDSAYLERFHREARLSAAITHPNVIRILEVGQDGESYFMALEYQPLSLHHLIRSQDQMPVERAVDIAAQIALGLEAAHQHGIVHRDIKPQNILIGPEGTAKVTDFGIGRAAALSTMTRTGAVMGTPHYMSPEQARGDRVDIRTDVYALGIVLYQMLTGEVPFDAETPWEVIRQHIEVQAKPVKRLRTDIPPALEKIVQQCLEKDPERRFSTPQEVALALERAGLRSSEVRPQPRPLPRQPSRRSSEPAAARVMVPEPPAPKRSRSPFDARQARKSPRRFPWGRLLGYATAAAVVVTLALVATAPATQEVVRAAIAAMVVENNVEREVPREVVARPIEGSYDPVPPLVEREIDDFHIAVSEDSQRTIFGGPTFGMRRGATISGRVVDAETGLPIYDICLDAENTDWDGPNAWGCTDANGRYTLQGVAPGTYRIRIQTDKENYVQEYYKGKLSWDYADLVTIEGTESVKGIDFGLKAGATISGRVVDAQTGLPIPGVGIDLENTASGGPGSWADTGADGTYVLWGVAPGVYRIRARSNDQGYIEAFYGDTLNWDYANLLTVRGAAEPVTDIDISLRQGSTISGRVVDAQTGLPIPGVGIDLENASGGPGSWADTGADGTYVLRGVAPGVYRIRARSNDQGYIEAFYGDTLNWDYANLLTVRGAEPVTDIDISLRLGATISGRVVNAETGLPVPGVGIDLENTVSGGTDSWADTDADGRYSLRGVAPGTYRIRAKADDYIQQYHENRLFWESADFVTVRGTDPVDGIDFRLATGATITGKVIDEATGQPIVNLEVTARQPEGEHLAWGTTNADGDYVLRGLPGGEIEISIWGQGYIEERRTVTIHNDNSVIRVDF